MHPERKFSAPDESASLPFPGSRSAARLDGQDFSGRVIEGLVLVDQTVRRARFERSTIRKAVFARSTFFECSFNGANLEDSDFTRAVFENCDFRDARLSGVNAGEAVFRGTQVLSYANKREISLAEPAMTFSGATIERSAFTGANMIRAKLANVRANDVDFTGADLREAVFDACTISGAEFNGARLDGTDFSRSEDALEALPDWARSKVTMVRRLESHELLGVLREHQAWLASDGKAGRRLVMRNADLSQVKLDGRDLSGCDLRDSRLDFASLRRAKLVASDLRGTSFVGTDFSRADLREALTDPEALARARLDGARR